MALNDTENGTWVFEDQKIPRPFVILMRTQGTVIVLLNLVVLITLASKKSKFPAVYWLQIVCLAFNDMVAGLANFLISFIDLPYIKESLSNCSIAVVFLYSSQSASLYNIFGICIHRFIVLKRADLSRGLWKHRHTIFCTTAAWTLSLFLCSLPVALFNKPEIYMKIKFCSLKPIFGEDISKGMLIMMGSFIVPLIFTNIMYITLFCMLKSVLRTVIPVSTRSELGSMFSVRTVLTRRNSNKTTVTTNISNQSFSSDTSKGHASRDRPKRKSTRGNLFLAVPERKKTVELRTVSKNIEPSTSTCSYDRKQIDPNYPPDDKPTHQASSYDSPVILRQRKAFILLGIILLFLNIFSWPAIAALLLTSMVDSISLDRNTLLPLFTTICFNSVVNPILYTATILEFRAALIDMVYSIFKIFKC